MAPSGGSGNQPTKTNMAQPRGGSYLVQAQTPACRTRVLILGDSFISRLKGYAREEEHGCSFGLEDCINISWLGIPDATADRIDRSNVVRQRLHEFQPAVVVLQVGSNDLCSARSKADAWQVGYQISCLAEKLLNQQSVKFVLVIGVLPRSRPGKFTRDVKLYNDRMVEVNDYLDMTVEGDDLKFFILHRIGGMIDDLTLPDGVHLTAAGLHRHYNNMKYAVIHAVKGLRPARKFGRF